MRYDSAGTPPSPWEMTSASPYPVATAGPRRGIPTACSSAGGCRPPQPNMYNPCRCQAARARPSNSSSNPLASWSNPVGDSNHCVRKLRLVEDKINPRTVGSRVAFNVAREANPQLRHDLVSEPRRENGRTGLCPPEPEAIWNSRARLREQKRRMGRAGLPAPFKSGICSARFYMTARADGSGAGKGSTFSFTLPT